MIEMNMEYLNDFHKPARSLTYTFNRRISDNLSRGSLVGGRDDEPFSPIWPRPASVSRDTSDADTLFSDVSASSSAANQFGTLPRGTH